MVDIYCHSHEVDEVVIGSISYDAFTCTLDNNLTCASSNSSVFCDQSIITPASSSEYNVHFTDDVDIASFDKPEKFLADNTFRYISL